MENLYIKTEHGTIPIEKEQIEKYHLEVGSIPPNGYRVVDENGNENKKPKEDNKNPTLNEMNSKGTIFTQSEAIDISQGVDSEL